MTQKFINPLSKFTTDTLQSLPYSTLTFSVNGSSTAKAVYADKSKTTSLGAVATSDSAGIFPPIWLDGTYRAILKNAAGVTMTGWPIDSVGDAQNFTAFSAWDSTFTYDITTNSFVTGSDGNYYQSIQNPNFNKDPISQPAYWTRIYFLPTWNASVNYAVDVLVIYNGLLYKSNATGINHAPPNLSFWDNVSFNASITGPFTATGDITGGSLNTAGNLNFSSASNRITGDLSSATAASRVGFQTSTANGGTKLSTMPNGSGVLSGIYAHNAADPSNSGYLSLYSSSTENAIDANKNGTGSYLPLNFYTSSTLKLAVTADGRLYGTALHNNAGSMTGIANQYIGSGTAIPTASNFVNCSNPQSASQNWIRVGNVVTVSGVVTITVTTQLLTTTVRLTMPISSNNGAIYGSAVNTTSPPSAYGNITNGGTGQMSITFTAPSGTTGGAYTMEYCASYVII